MKKERLQINPPLWEGPIQDYLEKILRKDEQLWRKLLSGEMPSEGWCGITSTPGDYYGPTYKDFTAKSLAVLLGNADEIDIKSLRGVIYLSSNGEVDRLWQVWLMDIMRNDLKSHIRYIWNQVLEGGVVTIENINSDLQPLLLSNGQGRAAGSVIDQLKRLLPGLKILEMEESKAGRPQGSGWFKNVSEFLTALEEVLKSNRKRRPLQLQVLKSLDEHPLCQRPGEDRDQSQTKALRNWIKAAGLKNYKKALEKYWPGYRKGK